MHYRAGTLGKAALFTISYVIFAMAAAALCGSPGTESLGELEHGDTKEVVQNLMPVDEVAGWKRDGEPLVYDSLNLWEYIDGSAEMYLAYDFEELIVQDFLSEGGKSLKVEIYRHADPLDAFGIYSMYRDPSADFFRIGNEAFADDYCLHMWKGSFYVHICVFEEDSSLTGAMTDFARVIADGIKEVGELPSWVGAFPDSLSGAAVVRKSVSYIRGGIVGRGWYPPAFSIEYRVGGTVRGGAKVYLSRPGGEDEAGRVLERLIQSFEGSVRIELLPLEGLETFTAEDRYLGKVFVARYKNWVLLGTGFPADEKALAVYMKEMVARLR